MSYYKLLLCILSEQEKKKTFDVREERDYTWCSAEIKGDVI